MAALNGVTVGTALRRYCPIREISRSSQLVSEQLGSQGGVEHSFCLGDACMMWRWSDKEVGNCGLARPLT